MALWSGRFDGETADGVLKMGESISVDRRLYCYDVKGSKAHVKMLAAQKIIPEATARQISSRLDEIEKAIENGDFKFDLKLEDIHMHIENALISALGDEGARVHSGRSRNDQVALDVRLYLRDQLDELVEKVGAFQKALVDRAAADPRAVMPGFTHLQHAQVVLFAHHCLAYVEMFDRDAARLLDCRNRMNFSPLGAGAIAGSTLPLDREAVAHELGFDGVLANSMDAVADRDFIIEALSAISILAMHISRLSEDIILWSSQEFDFIELADRFCTGSSLMPQKKNPDVAELSRGKSARIFGDLITVLTLCKGLPLTYNRDLQEDKAPLFDALDNMMMILDVYPEMIATMKIKPDKMLAAASDPALMATDLAEKLVEFGVPFRTAHHRIGALVKYCRESGKALNMLELDEMQKVVPEATSEFLSMFDPVKSVGAREIIGGTGYNAVAREIDKWQKKLKSN